MQYPSPIRFVLVALVAATASAAPTVAQGGPGKGYSQVPRGALSIVAEVRAKRGKEAELRAATLPLVELVRGDPKNLAYFLQEDREAPGHFIFYEIRSPTISSVRRGRLPSRRTSSPRRRQPDCPF
jgi:hypothetical protein